jgi:hypothetical protein
VSLLRFNETIDITNKTGKVSEETRGDEENRNRETVVVILDGAASMCTESRRMVTWLMTEFESIWKEAALA